MTTQEIADFRTKLAEADFEEHADAEREPDITWINLWDGNGNCVGVECYQNGVKIKGEDRLADQAQRAKDLALIEEKDIPEELKK
jgi:hypothetical protein